MVRVSSLRASDADRETTAEQLRHATAEGRLTPDELEQRLDALFASKTYGEIDALVGDLPVSRAPARTAPRGVRPPLWVPAVVAGALLSAVLGTLGGGDGRSGDGFDRWHRDGQFGAGGPFGGGHHLVAAAASTALTVAAVVAVCVALLWACVRHRDLSRT